MEVALLGADVRRSTYYNWRRAYARDGLRGLAPRSRRPHRFRSPQWPPLAEIEVWGARRRYPYMGRRRLQALLAEDWLMLSESMVGRILAMGEPEYLKSRRSKMRAEEFQRGLAYCRRAFAILPVSDEELIETYVRRPVNPAAVETLVSLSMRPENNFARKCVVKLVERFLEPRATWTKEEQWPGGWESEWLEDIRGQLERWVPQTARSGDRPRQRRGRAAAYYLQSLAFATMQMLTWKYGCHPTSKVVRPDPKDDVETQCRNGGAPCDVVRLALHERGVDRARSTIAKMWTEGQEMELPILFGHEVDGVHRTGVLSAAWVEEWTARRAHLDTESRPAPRIRRRKARVQRRSS